MDGAEEHVGVGQTLARESGERSQKKKKNERNKSECRRVEMTKYKSRL